MRIVPLPEDLDVGDQRKVTLGPPRGMSDEDCATIQVLIGDVELPSGARAQCVSALVFIEPDELERIREAGGYFWFRALGHTFPPVMFAAPENGT